MTDLFINDASQLSELERGTIIQVTRLVIQHISTLSIIKLTPNIKQLDISYWPNLSTKNFTILTNLEQLYLTSCNLKSFENLEKCTLLTMLDVGHNMIDSFAPLRELINLTSLTSYTKSATIDFTPLKRLTNLQDLSCNVCSNIHILHNVPGLRICYDYDDEDWTDFVDDSEVKTLVYHKHTELLEKYVKLVLYSREKEFVDCIDTKFQDTDNIFIKLEKLEAAYDKLEHAPHGPVYNEGLKFFVRST